MARSCTKYSPSSPTQIPSPSKTPLPSETPPPTPSSPVPPLKLPERAFDADLPGSGGSWARKVAGGLNWKAKPKEPALWMLACKVRSWEGVSIRVPPFLPCSGRDAGMMGGGGVSLGLCCCCCCCCCCCRSNAGPWSCGCGKACTVAWCWCCCWCCCCRTKPAFARLLLQLLLPWPLSSSLVVLYGRFSNIDWWCRLHPAWLLDLPAAACPSSLRPPFPTPSALAKPELLPPANLAANPASLPAGIAPPDAPPIAAGPSAAFSSELASTTLAAAPTPPSALPPSSPS